MEATLSTYGNGDAYASAHFTDSLRRRGTHRNPFVRALSRLSRALIRVPAPAPQFSDASAPRFSDLSSTSFSPSLPLSEPRSLLFLRSPPPFRRAAEHNPSTHTLSPSWKWRRFTLFSLLFFAYSLRPFLAPLPPPPLHPAPLLSAPLRPAPPRSAPLDGPRPTPLASLAPP